MTSDWKYEQDSDKGHQITINSSGESNEEMTDEWVKMSSDMGKDHSHTTTVKNDDY